MGKEGWDRVIFIFKYNICIFSWSYSHQLYNIVTAKLKVHIISEILYSRAYMEIISFSTLDCNSFEAFCSPHIQSSLASCSISDAKKEKKKQDYFRLQPEMLQPLACPSAFPLQRSLGAVWVAAG